MHKDLGPGSLENAYQALMNLPLGLLMNFGQATFKDGLRRVANDYHGQIG